MVLLALVAVPVVTSELAISTHAHIREVVEPLDATEVQIADRITLMEGSFLRYVITGDPTYVEAYERARRGPQEAIPSARTQAERLSPVAARQVQELEQAIQRWQQFTEPTIALRQGGRIEEAQAAIATGLGAQLMNDIQQQDEVLHQLIVTERDSDRDRLDQMLNAQVVLSVPLGLLGILAAVFVAHLSRRIARLYEEVRSQRDRVAELAERERQRAGELDAIIENMAEGVAVIDQSGQVVRLNRVARQIWELPWPEGQHGHIRDFAPLDFRYPDGKAIPLEDWPINRALRGETFRDFEATYVRSDGRRYHLRFGGSALRDESGNVILAINVFYDISEIRDLERQREEFISVVAHDLKGAMTIIRGYSGLLLRSKDKFGLTPSLEKAIDTIADQTRRLDRMIDDLLDVSRIEARRLKLEKRPVDLVSLIQDVVGRTQEMTRGHQVTSEVRDTIPAIYVDPDRIEQIMTNLLSNAAKYSYPETPIIVDVERREGEVMVSVTNAGPGIKREDVPKLFTRFYRTEAAQLEKAPGLGLGLYITKGLVEAHGGRIWVESEPGRYTTFHFTVPAV